jgi:ABC-type nitrate/sulfonate/bicarbonate transport system substrate-binding protein
MDERVGGLGRLLASAGLVFLVAACSGGGTPSKPASAPPAGSAAGGASSPGAAGGSASGSASSAAPAAAQSTAAPALEPVKMAFTTIAAVQAPFWIAQEAGYFREQGLEVPDLNRVEPGATLLAALHNGELEFVAAGGPSLVLGNLQGLDTMIFGSTLNLLETEIVARPEIRTPEDLRGKVVAVSRLKAISDLAVRLSVARFGLDPDRDLQVRGTGGNAESLAALETGGVAAASVSVPVVFEAHKRGFPTVIDVTQMRIPFTNGGIGATKRTLDQRQPAAEKVLRALALATARFKTDREYTASVVGKYTSITDPEALRGTIEVYAPIMTVDPYPDQSAVQATIDAEEHEAARTARPQQVSDTRAAEAVRRSGFLDNLPKD